MKNARDAGVCIGARWRDSVTCRDPGKAQDALPFESQSPTAQAPVFAQ